MSIVAIVTLIGVIASGTADAQPAQHVPIHINESFESDFWTQTCGTTVLISVDASLNVTLLYNRAGLIAKEIDPAGGGKTTFTAPVTGKSFSYPFQPGIIDYGAGAKVDSNFTLMSVGLNGHVPGLIASSAGQTVITGMVFGFDENGIPLLDFQEVLLQHGNFQSSEDINAAVCGALTA